MSLLATRCCWDQDFSKLQTARHHRGVQASKRKGGIAPGLLGGAGCAPAGAQPFLQRGQIPPGRESVGSWRPWPPAQHQSSKRQPTSILAWVTHAVSELANGTGALAPAARQLSCPQRRFSGHACPSMGRTSCQDRSLSPQASLTTPTWERPSYLLHGRIPRDVPISKPTRLPAADTFSSQVSNPPAGKSNFYYFPR